MTKYLVAVAVALAGVAAVAPVSAATAEAATSASAATKGKMLVDASGARLAPVYRVEADGSAAIVFEGRMVTVPASTLSVADGKLTTSLKKSDVIALR